MEDLLHVDHRLYKALQKRKEQESFRSLKVVDDLIDFSSNDYLGLTRNADFQQKVFERLNETSFGSGGSRLLAGNKAIHEQVEEQLRAAHQGEAALLFNSGYAVNLAFFSAVPSRGDTVLFDEHIHACVKDGVRLGLAKHFSFRHNDLNDLESKLKRIQGQAFVAVESIYSMHADRPDFPELVSLCERFGAALVVDEAHATGVFGVNGGGLLVELGLQDRVLARMFGFGKGIGTFGGCIVGSQVLKDYLINFGRSFIYSTALPPANVLMIQEAYQAIEDQPDWALGVRAKAQRMRKKLGLPETEVPIVPVPIGGNERTRKIAASLVELGFDVRGILSPTVPIGEERLRVCVHRHNSMQEIDHLVEELNRSKEV